MQHRTMRVAILAIASAIVGLTMVASSPAHADRCTTNCNQDYWLKCLKRTQGSDDYRTRHCQIARDACYAKCSRR